MSVLSTGPQAGAEAPAPPAHLASTTPPPGPSTDRAPGVITTGELAALVRAEIVGPADLPIRGVEALDRAEPGMITFIRHSGYAADWHRSRATAALVTRGIDVPGHDPRQRTLLIVADADRAMATLLARFAPPPARRTPGIDPTAIVDPTARVSPSASIGPLCTVGAGAVIADGVVLAASVHIGAAATIGPGTFLHPGVVIYDRCQIGPQCLLHANVVIGADGFGFLPAPDQRGLQKIPHIGHVEVGAGVEIGAGSCIDRGKFGATTIGDGTKIDNLVQIGHNCRIGRCVVICGCTGIAGSVTIGDGAQIGGGAGIADNLRVGPGARVAGRSGVVGDVPAGTTVFGYPAGPHRDMMRAAVFFRRLPELFERLERLEARAASLPPSHLPALPTPAHAEPDNPEGRPGDAG